MSGIKKLLIQEVGKLAAALSKHGKVLGNRRIIKPMLLSHVFSD